MVRFRRATMVTLSVLLSTRLLAMPASQAQDALANAAAAQQNLRDVLAFQELFFNQHDLGAADRFVAEHYVQHNPGLRDGRTALVETFAKIFKKNPQAHAEVIRTAVDRDLVYVHLHFTSGPSDRGRAIVNIYRVSDGQITEHWDVVQTIPDQAANSNTMF